MSEGEGIEVLTRPPVSPGFSLAWLLDAWRLDRQIRCARPNLFHAFFQWNLPLWRLPMPSVGHVYDLMPLALEEFYVRRGGLAVGRKIHLYRRYLKYALGRLDRVITISEHSRRDLVRLMGFRQERIHVVHPAPAPGMKSAHDPARMSHLRSRLGLPESYLLYVGGYDYRKNVETLLDAHVSARKQGLGLSLVLAGGMESPYGRRIAERAWGTPGVLLPGHIPEEDLPTLYAGARLVLYPSLYEGFGLPVLDAMACGVPVICSSAPSLAEAAGNAVLRLPPGEKEAWAEAMCRAEEESFCEDLRRRGLSHVKKFSWERAARETLRVYEAVAGGA